MLNSGNRQGGMRRIPSSFIGVYLLEQESLIK